jgi:hypothetical protein
MVEETFDFMGGLVARGVVEPKKGSPLTIPTLVGEALLWTGSELRFKNERASIVETLICENGRIHLTDAPISAGGQLVRTGAPG